MKRLFAAALIAICATTPVLAESYKCTFENPGPWIPPVLIIFHDRDSGEVAVTDSVSVHFDVQPTDISVAADNAKRITFKWTLEGTKNKHGQYAVRFNFRATYLKKKEKMIVVASPIGYTNTYRGEGNCDIEA